jgi:hypothetical protein
MYVWNAASLSNRSRRGETCAVWFCAKEGSEGVAQPKSPMTIKPAKSVDV